MATAALVFHIAPDAFWRLSFKEWIMLSAGAGAAHGGTLNTQELRALMMQYPDNPPKE